VCTVTVARAPVAFFYAFVHNTVAAPRSFTVTQAVIGVGAIAIIAFFFGIDDAIATSRKYTVGATGVRRGIAVVTAIVARFVPGPCKPITAPRLLAGSKASVRVECVAVIARFARIDDPISTGRVSTVGATAIGHAVGIAVSLVAFFYAIVYEAVPTARGNASAEAAIVV